MVDVKKVYRPRELQSHFLKMRFIMLLKAKFKKKEKHLTLGLTLKSLTSSRRVVEIINRYGHCCSCRVAEELETKATITSFKHSAICLEGIISTRGLHTGVHEDFLKQ